MSRLRDILQANAQAGSTSLGLFITTGYPVEADIPKVLDAMVAGGADFIELGMPFSDPLAEGETIQRSSERALASGVTMSHTLETARAFSNRHSTPLVLMGYVNPVFRYGLSNFFQNARSCGVDAVILPDLPPEEAATVRDAASAAGVDLVFLIAPTTPDERVRQIDTLSDGFVYAVSVAGVTGSVLEQKEDLMGYLSRARAMVQKNPLLVGFGISTRDDIVELSRHTDGCIVGSAFIRKLESLWNDPDLSASERLDAVRVFVSELKYGSLQ